MKKLLLLFFFLPFIAVQSIFGQANHIVISEVYGGGGNAGATFLNDFVELYNPTNNEVSLSGWSIQYASAAGTTWNNTVALTGTIKAKSFYLIQLASGGSNGASLPPSDVSGGINMSATSGKVLLANTTTIQSGSLPNGSQIIDLVGFGTSANGFEGSAAAPANSSGNVVNLSSSTSAERKAFANSDATSMTTGADVNAGNGYDSDDNKADFVLRLPQPQNSASPSEGSSSNSPTIAGVPNSIFFLSQTINTTSTAKSVTINYSNLTTADVSMTSTLPFTISKSETGTYSNSLNYTNAELSSNTTNVFVKFSPITSGNTTSTINIFGGGVASTATVNLSGFGYDPNFEINTDYTQNFDDINYLSNSYWTQVSVKGAVKTWEYTATQTHAGAGAAYMNGFNETETDGDGNQPSDDWLISPKINLTGFSNFPVVNFWSRKFFVGADIKFYVSTTYNGSGVINLNEWAELTDVGIPSATGVWTKSNGIDLSAYKTANVHIAFRYVTDNSGNSNSAEWRVDDFSLANTNATASIPTTVISFPETLAGNTSAESTFNFSASGYGDLTLTAPLQFEISGDNVTYGTTVTVVAVDAASGKTIYVRFKPTSTTAAATGTVSVNATGLTVQGPKFFGSSLARSTTFDLASWNMEFFGNGTTIPNYGPANRSLQISNAAIVYNKLLPDVIGIQEISDETAVDQLLASLPSTYRKKISQVYSYSIKPPNSPDPFPAQKVGFIYNSATVDTLSFKVVFLDEYRAAVANGATNTFNIDNNSWSSGRLPYLGRFNVTTQDGLKKTVNVTVIHAKSGSNTADYNRREQDILGLKDFLLANYPASVAVLGDYNDLVEGSIASGRPSPFKVIADNGYRALTLPLLQSGQGTFVGSNNPSMIDNIMITNDLSLFYEANSTRIEDARTYISNYANNTSDHLPVYARFTFPMGTLPIKLASFTALASGNRTNLRWTTETEVDNDYFLIERAGDDQKFVTIDRIKGSGTTTARINYNAVDYKPLNGNNYYRLKQVDFNGESTTSEERVVNFRSLSNRTLTVYPNPTRDQINLALTDIVGNVNLNIVGIDGKTVFSDSGSLDTVNQKLNSKIGSFAAGIYIIALTANGEQQKVKFVKQ